ncbi:putative small lipoprotein YifL [Rhodanobacter sp. TND4EL1]
MKLLPILLCLVALGACSRKPPEPQAKPAAVSTPFDAMRADEQRAKDVSKTLEKQSDDQRKQIEAAQ